MNNPYQSPNSDIFESNLDGEDYELAGRGARLGAYIIDNLILMIVLIPCMFLFGIFDKIQHQYAEMANGLPIGDTIMLSLAGILTFLIVNGYFIAKNGQTIGKKLLGIRVQSLDGNVLSFGGYIGKRQLPVWIFQMIPVVGGLISLVDILFIFRSDRRCIHDLIAGTRVVINQD